MVNSEREQENHITEQQEQHDTESFDETTAADGVSSAPEEELDETTRLQHEVAEAKDKYLRLFAEFENFRRRTAKERLELVTTASEKVMSDLLPVIDDFERSLQIFKENEAVAPMYEGIELVHGKLTKTLEQKGLKPMEVSIGNDFDSEYHEAVVQTPAPSEDLKGKVVDVIDKGYFLGEKVLRYAKVVIGS